MMEGGCGDVTIMGTHAAMLPVHCQESAGVFEACIERCITAFVSVCVVHALCSADMLLLWCGRVLHSCGEG
jgi:hypothetical protein